MNSDEKFIKYGKTLSGLIHNLNTPLMGMSGRIELMQMKFGEDKNVVQISAQLDRINAMLTSMAYLLDNEISNKDNGFDLQKLLENYFTYLTTDMKFKHKIEKNINLVPHAINTNSSDLLNFVHCILIQLLTHVDDEASITISNSIDGNNAILDFVLTLPNEVPKEVNITDEINKRLFSEIKNKYVFKAQAVGNKIAVRMGIKSNS